MNYGILKDRDGKENDDFSSQLKINTQQDLDNLKEIIKMFDPEDNVDYKMFFKSRTYHEVFKMFAKDEKGSNHQDIMYSNDNFVIVPDDQLKGKTTLRQNDNFVFKISPTVREKIKQKELEKLKEEKNSIKERQESIEKITQSPEFISFSSEKQKSLVSLTNSSNKNGDENQNDAFPEVPEFTLLNKKTYKIKVQAIIIIINLINRICSKKYQ